jgi:lipoic acid synthetase
MNESVEKTAGTCGVDMLTIGPYLQPRPGKLTVRCQVAPQQFNALVVRAKAMGFAHAACGPRVWSSHCADQQALTAAV